MQDWPAWLNPATLILAAAVAQSPSGSMTTGALLPSSRPTFLVAARARMPQPTGGEPVKVIMATSGCSTRWLAVDPAQGTTFSHPGGSPHSSISSSASFRADSGVAEAGLSTTGQPAAIAGATLWHTRLRGKLNGEIPATTPMGTRLTQPTFPSPAEEASSGISSPPSVRATAAEKLTVSTARAASTRAVLMGLAASAEITVANSSTRSARSRAARSSTAARSWAGKGPARCSAAAMATAWSRCFSVPLATVPTMDPSKGERTSMLSSEATRSSPMIIGIWSAIGDPPCGSSGSGSR